MYLAMIGKSAKSTRNLEIKHSPSQGMICIYTCGVDSFANYINEVFESQFIDIYDNMTFLQNRTSSEIKQIRRNQ